jgi:hypothetical protein
MDDSPSTNPFNDRPTVRLFDQAGVELGTISQREAGRLLRRGHADLVLDVPPAVQLNIATEDYQAIAAGGASEAALEGQFLHARRGTLYGNVHFEGPAGQTMFHGDAEKALWYLNRGLVEVVSRAPPVLRFRFVPGGPGHAGDDYYLAGKANRCVVCGAGDGLNRHHVVPSVYRRHLPREVKDHSHHDVLLLCLECHERYEAAADQLKMQFGAESGVPLHGLRGERDRDRGQAVKLALALVRYGEQIPPARQDEMRRLIGEWAGRWPLSDADVAAVAGLAAGDADGAVIEHGQSVVARTEDVQAFIRRWREHFLNVMQPRFLPAHWDVDRPAQRDRTGPDE